jgi:negative regulator of flagellin synthesis FlgM
MQEDDGSMRIYGDKPNFLLNPLSHRMGAISPRQTEASRPQGRETQADQLYLSPQAREIQQAGQLLAQTPDVREAKVIALKQDIESGHYDVKSEHVAEKLVQHHLLDFFY